MEGRRPDVIVGIDFGMTATGTVILPCIIRQRIGRG